MRFLVSLALALTAAVSLAASPADAATCQAGGLTCPTTMPVGGYCECKSGGATRDGTVVERAAPAKLKQSNATSGGCGSDPGAPGCR